MVQETFDDCQCWADAKVKEGYDSLASSSRVINDWKNFMNEYARYCLCYCTAMNKLASDDEEIGHTSRLVI